MKKRLTLILVVMMVSLLAFGCSKNDSNDSSNVPENADNVTDNSTNDESKPSDKTDKQSIILSTTTSTQDSGLLDYLLPKFTEETGIEVKVISVGTGKAIQMGKDGEADVLLVHSTADEEAFVAEGHGPARYDVMYNDFILVGPKDDPTGVKAASSSNIVDSLKLIADKQATFVSRADDSGTHKKELKLWKTAAIEPSGDWYIEAGQGMGDVLKMTDEKTGYTIADRATYLSMKDTLELEIVTENDTNLYNQYGVIVVDPTKNENINGEGALKFQEWLLSESTQKLIAEFGKEEYGQSLFIPNAK